MQWVQLKLFKDFTFAEERNDIHTSAAAMMRDFVEQMDLPNIKLMLSEFNTIGDAECEAFYSKLQTAFLYMTMSGNTALESGEGRCNVCHPNSLAFVFRGTNVPWHMSFLFHIKDNKVVEIHECMLLWKQFPELEACYQLYLDEEMNFVHNGDEDMDDPPF
jgi:hypothetical protein